MLTRNRVLGMVAGGAIGDAAGKPVETWTPERILEVHPAGLNVGKYLPPIGHKWFKEEDHPPGSTTDDKQLKQATFAGLVTGNPLSAKIGVMTPIMNAVADEHCKEFKITTDGWGRTTREAVRDMCNGVSWMKAGENLSFGGTGNGVPMKVAPWAAWLLSPAARPIVADPSFVFDEWLIHFSSMTHYTKLSAWSSIVHGNAVKFCLQSDQTDPVQFVDDFLHLVSDELWCRGEKGEFTVDGLRDTGIDPDDKDDTFEMRLIWLFQNRHRITEISRDEIRDQFNNGSCFVKDSVPFTYAYFLRDPNSPKTIIDCCEAGGDTDTNASMIGEMIGALHGIEIFETEDWKWMLEGLQGWEELKALAESWCDQLGVEE